MRKFSLELSGITVALQCDWNREVNVALREHIATDISGGLKLCSKTDFYASWTWLMSYAVIYSKNFSNNQSSPKCTSLWFLQYLCLVYASLTTLVVISYHNFLFIKKKKLELEGGVWKGVKTKYKWICHSGCTKKRLCPFLDGSEISSNWEG